MQINCWGESLQREHSEKCYHIQWPRQFSINCKPKILKKAYKYVLSAIKLALIHYTSLENSNNQ